MKIITDESCLLYHSQGHPERPRRISCTLEKLRCQPELHISWGKPASVERSVLLRAHSANHLERIRQPRDFDADTAAYPKIWEHAERSVGAALQALALAREGETAFSLIRPPGHHAERERAMGFCYLNQIAIAALEALADSVEKVAVYDFDVHHGNGTQAILLDHPGCAFFSIHQHPCYPHTGAVSVRNCHNYPVSPGATREVYRDHLAKALEDLQCWKPDLIAISAGFDAYARDPLADEPMEAEDFYWLGSQFRGLNIPNFSVLEGGYSDDLPELILAYLKGLEGAGQTH